MFVLPKGAPFLAAFHKQLRSKIGHDSLCKQKWKKLCQKAQNSTVNSPQMPRNRPRNYKSTETAVVSRNFKTKIHATLEEKPQFLENVSSFLASLNFQSVKTKEF